MSSSTARAAPVANTGGCTAADGERRRPSRRRKVVTASRPGRWTSSTPRRDAGRWRLGVYADVVEWFLASGAKPTERAEAAAADKKIAKTLKRARRNAE